MKDPYILKSGILKNKLGITQYEELNEATKNIGFVKMINAEKDIKNNASVEDVKAIHKHIFGDVFDWAGEFRTVPLYKEEIVIPGLSLTYGEPKNIEKDLSKILNEMNEFDWEKSNIDTISKKFTNLLARLWRVHPFRDGNTRTTLTFANTFAKENGFEMNIALMLNNLNRKVDEKGKVKQYSIRDFFVLAALDEKDYPEPEHLEKLIKASIEQGIDKKIDSLTRIKEGNEDVDER